MTNFWAIVLLLHTLLCIANALYGYDASRLRPERVNAPETFSSLEGNSMPSFNDHKTIQRSKRASEMRPPTPDPDLIIEPEPDVVDGNLTPLLPDAEAYCSSLGHICRNVPRSIPEVVCILKCLFNNNLPTFQPFLSVFPYVSQLLCQGTNTPFPTFPEYLLKSTTKLTKGPDLVNHFLTSLTDYDDFAKGAARALPITLIKNLNVPEFDELKMLVKNYELHDSNDKRGDTSGRMTAVSVGSFINENCLKSNLDGDTATLASIIKKRKCLSDILLPGYFVFSRAPKLADTGRIESMLRAWNMPLFLFAGVKCCMMPFADEKKTYECANPLRLFETPHGLRANDGFVPASEVCGAVPDIMDIGSDEEGDEDNGGIIGGNKLNGTLVVDEPREGDYSMEYSAEATAKNTDPADVAGDYQAAEV